MNIEQLNTNAMKTETRRRHYAAPSLVSERVLAENGFAASAEYTLGGGGRYEEYDRNDNGTI